MKFKLIGAATCWGAKIKSCEKGPLILKEQKLLEHLIAKGFDVDPTWTILFPEKQASHGDISQAESIPLIEHFNKHLASIVEKTLEDDEFPIILGGDHCIAIGTWNGTYRYLQKNNLLPMGLIWIDAHLDAHTLETTPSGNWHGMPVAGLLGYGHKIMAKLLHNDPILSPGNICLIGPRSFEKEEHDLLISLNVRIFYPEEIKEKGLYAVMQEAIDHVSRSSKCFGVSLDLDVITPEEAPGVGSPEKNGLHTDELLHALKLLNHHPRLEAFELVEYNPERNHHHQTSQICLKILSTIMDPQ